MVRQLIDLANPVGSVGWFPLSLEMRLPSVDLQIYFVSWQFVFGKTVLQFHSNVN